MKIYTRTGDEGQTSLFGGGRVSKQDIRVVASEPRDFEAALFDDIQRQLFAIGAWLASPDPEKVAKALKKAVLSEDSIVVMEEAIDRADAELDPMTAFVLPGGGWKAALLHLARTVCRRAERSVVALNEAEPVPPVVLAYLNRLSDLLFALARLANRRSNITDQVW